jgi:hypothetical protein
VGQPFDKVATAPRVDHGVGVSLLLQEQLRVASDPGREVSWQGQSLIERVGVQTLGVPLSCSHRLDARADHIVVHILRCEAPAAGLAVCSKGETLRVFWIKLFNDLGPQQPGGAEFRDLHENVLADCPEER